MQLAHYSKGAEGVGKWSTQSDSPYLKGVYTREQTCRACIEHTAAGGPNDELATTKKGTTIVPRLVPPNDKYR